MSQYIVTMRWYVESDDLFEKESMVLSKKDKKKKIIDILKHRENGTECCSNCPTHKNESSVVLDWKDFYEKKPIYMSVNKVRTASK